MCGQGQLIHRSRLGRGWVLSLLAVLVGAVMLVRKEIKEEPGEEEQS